MKKTFNKITYEKSGVNIKKADKLIDNIKESSAQRNSSVISEIGGFASLYSLKKHKYKEPVIVSGTDGVGTKLKIAKSLNEHRFIGQDLVAMCVNDVITVGAMPLFFLDYLATSKLDLRMHTTILKGIKRACSKIGIPLIGGETAEMPGMYSNKDYDLAGFCVGIVDKDKIIKKQSVRRGDVIIGLKSSGLHSNGFSLINKLISEKRISLKSKIGSMTIGSKLITPTKLYVDAFEVIKKHKLKSIHGAAHITGGGLTENLPRVIPDHLCAKINLNSWKMSEIFNIVQSRANINNKEMLRIFNCGIGMILIIDSKNKTETINVLKKIKYSPIILGEVMKSENRKKILYV
mgnify:CR=1 FL=1